MKSDLAEVLRKFVTDVFWTLVTILYVPAGALIGAAVGVTEMVRTVAEIWTNADYLNKAKDWNSWD